MEPKQFPDCSVGSQKNLKGKTTLKQLVFEVPRKIQPAEPQSAGKKEKALHSGQRMGAVRKGERAQAPCTGRSAHPPRKGEMARASGTGQPTRPRRKAERVQAPRTGQPARPPRKGEAARASRTGQPARLPRKGEVARASHTGQPVRTRRTAQSSRKGGAGRAARSRASFGKLVIEQRGQEKIYIWQMQGKRICELPAGRLFFGSAFVMILLLSGVITYLLETPARLAEAKSESAAQAASESRALEEAMRGQTLAGENVGPVMQSKPEMVKIDAQRVKLPENGRVDMSYFDDVVFIGDSLTQGFLTYTNYGFPLASFAAYKGAGPRTFIEGTITNESGEKMRPIDQILEANAGKYYIQLGGNALENSTDEAFLKYYNDFLDFLLPQLPPNAVCYLQSILPVSENRAKNEKFSLERIQRLNDQIAQMAYQRGIHYLDVYEALSNEAGALREDVRAEDGLHLNAQGYAVWREYLITHTAYQAQAPYLPGSPFSSVLQGLPNN